MKILTPKERLRESAKRGANKSYLNRRVSRKPCFDQEILSRALNLCLTDETKDTKTEDIYYVYVHKDPLTSEVMYIGKGKYGRAWSIRGRREEHKNAVYGLLNQGIMLNDIVRFIYEGLDEPAALRLEAEEIYKLNPTFNVQTPELSINSEIAFAKEIYQKSKFSLSTSGQKYSRTKREIPK